MKNNFIATVIIASALLWGGCNSDVINIPENNSDEVKVSFILPESTEISDIETRSMVFDGSTLTAQWLATDTVGIFPELGDQLAFSMGGSAGGTTAVFSGGSWALNKVDSYSSYFPFNRWNFFKNASEIEFEYTGQVQTGISNAEHISVYDYMYAPRTKAINGAINFSYNRVGFPMKITMTVPEIGTYESVYLKADEAIFITKAKLDLTTETPTLTPKATSKTHVLKLKNFTTTAANQKVMVFLMCYPINAQGKTFHIKLRSSTGRVFTASVSPSTNYGAGTTRNLTKTMAADTNESISFGGEISAEDSNL